MVKKRKIHKVRCPECYRELRGISEVRVMAMLKEHKKGKDHKNVVRALISMKAQGVI